jgi:hypothetical protein
VTLNQPGLRGAGVGFAERLLEVIDSGRRTATYKLALLIALLAPCARLSRDPAVCGGRLKVKGEEARPGGPGLLIICHTVAG